MKTISLKNHNPATAASAGNPPTQDDNPVMNPEYDVTPRPIGLSDTSPEIEGSSGDEDVEASQLTDISEESVQDGREEDILVDLDIVGIYLTMNKEIAKLKAIIDEMEKQRNTVDEIRENDREDGTLLNVTEQENDQVATVNPKKTVSTVFLVFSILVLVANQFPKQTRSTNFVINLMSALAGAVCDIYGFLIRKIGNRRMRSCIILVLFGLLYSSIALSLATTYNFLQIDCFWIRFDKEQQQQFFEQAKLVLFGMVMTDIWSTDTNGTKAPVVVSTSLISFIVIISTVACFAPVFMDSTLAWTIGIIPIVSAINRTPTPPTEELQNTTTDLANEDVGNEDALVDQSTLQSQTSPSSQHTDNSRLGEE